jgi:hypothetical protein
LQRGAASGFAKQNTGDHVAVMSRGAVLSPLMIAADVERLSLPGSD